MTLALLSTAQHVSDVNSPSSGACICLLRCVGCNDRGFVCYFIYLAVSAIPILCVVCVALSECVSASVWCPVVLEHFVCGMFWCFMRLY